MDGGHERRQRQAISEVDLLSVQLPTPCVYRGYVICGVELSPLRGVLTYETHITSSVEIHNMALIYYLDDRFDTTFSAFLVSEYHISLLQYERREIAHR